MLFKKTKQLFADIADNVSEFEVWMEEENPTKISNHKKF